MHHFLSIPLVFKQTALKQALSLIPAGEKEVRPVRKLHPFLIRVYVRLAKKILFSISLWNENSYNSIHTRIIL